jgi:hypothetical protein
VSGRAAGRGARAAPLGVRTERRGRCAARASRRVPGSGRRKSGRGELLDNSVEELFLALRSVTLVSMILIFLEYIRNIPI